MKKSLVALAVFGAFAGVASAQSSSVTLFGIVDTGVRAVKNGDGSTVKSLSNDGLVPSRIGFRGEEDLGDGLKAGFWLEVALGLDVGSGGGVTSTGTGGAVQAAKFFGRRSTVSLWGPFGEVRFGRDYTPTFLNLPIFDSYGAAGLGNILNLIGGTTSIATTGPLGSNAGTLSRADNTVAYFLPAKVGGGVYAQVMAAAGEGTNQTSGNNRYVGGRVGWTGGPIDVAGAYGRTRIPGNDDFRVWNVGASFKLPIIKLSALYYRSDYQPTGLDRRSQKLWAIGANMTLGLGELRATYQHSDMSGGRDSGIAATSDFGLRNQDDARQYAIGYIYNLSKRTAVYADIGRLQNRGRSQLSIPGGTLAGSGFGTVDNRNSTALALGVRHSF